MAGTDNRALTSIRREFACTDYACRTVCADPKKQPVSRLTCCPEPSDSWVARINPNGIRLFLGSADSATATGNAVILFQRGVCAREPSAQAEHMHVWCRGEQLRRRMSLRGKRKAISRAEHRPPPPLALMTVFTKASAAFRPSPLLPLHHCTPCSPLPLALSWGALLVQAPSSIQW